MKNKKIRKKFNLKQEYRKSWEFLKGSRKFVYGIIFVFVFFILIGFFLPAPEFLSKQILEFMEELLKKTEGLSGFEMIKFIFFNNLQSSFFGMVLGVFFGIFSIFLAVINGYILGFVSMLVVKSEGIFSLWRILPHGIFELPAIFISLGLGLQIGMFLFMKKKGEKFSDYLIKSLRVFLLIIIPLLILAAIIEGLLIFLKI